MKGFTLIELLVVVLIIGILSAVALPQYQKAVLKSRQVKALVLLKAIQTQLTEYELANGEWPASNAAFREMLDIAGIKWNSAAYGAGRVGDYLISYSDVYTWQHWVNVVYFPGTGYSISQSDKSSYIGASWYGKVQNGIRSEVLTCSANPASNLAVSVCQSITQKSSPSQRIGGQLGVLALYNMK